jgi:uncharacterized protein
MILRFWIRRRLDCIVDYGTRMAWGSRLRVLFSTVMVTAIVAACASAPATRFYVLNSVTRDSSLLSADGPSVVIRDVRLPQYLERPQLVTRDGDHKIRLSDEAQWAGNLQQDMVRVLTENLSQQLKSERVFSAPHNGPVKPDFRVDIEVLRFELGSDRRVMLSARWWLVRGDGNILIEAPSTVIYGQVVAERDIETVVASMSSVYAELAQQVARSVLRHGRSTP